jgi:ssRNA-specific RNase YbeY (16S rRNA maturation enzyme)
MNQEINEDEVSEFVLKHQEKLRALLEVPADENICLRIEVEQRGDKYPSGGYNRVYDLLAEANKKNKYQHNIVLFVHNINERSPAGFEGSFEEKLLFVLAHEMVHLKQFIDGKEDEHERMVIVDYAHYLKVKDQYTEQPPELDANKFAKDYAKRALA